MKYSDFKIADEGFIHWIKAAQKRANDKKEAKNAAKLAKTNPETTVKPTTKVRGISHNAAEISRLIAEKYPDLAKQEFTKRKEFIKLINKLKADLNHDMVNIIGGKAAEQWLTPMATPDDLEDMLFLTDLLPIKNKDDDEYRWAYYSEFIYPVYGYNLWAYAKIKDLPARDAALQTEFWELAKLLDTKALSVLSRSEYFLGLDCGGDWDSGTIDIIFKPSNKILDIAQKEFGYKWPKINLNAGYVR